jgi:hypothetical protein
MDCPLDEESFLEEEALAARSALQGNLGSARESILAVLDLRGWTREYPRTVLAGSAIAGLLAGLAVATFSAGERATRNGVHLPGESVPPVPEQRRRGKPRKDQSARRRFLRAALFLGEVLKALFRLLPDRSGRSFETGATPGEDARARGPSPRRR